MFYSLTRPDYNSDYALERCNPIFMKPEAMMPRVYCEKCGEWSSSDRLRMKLPSDPRKLGLSTPDNIRLLPLAEWLIYREKLALQLNINPDALSPGEKLGMPKAELRSTTLPDFLYHIPGIMVVQESVAQSIWEQRFTGVQLIPVECRWGKRVKDQQQPVPNIYEINVTGSGWRVGVNEETIRICEECGRDIFPDTRYDIDEERWDKSDFFILDKNPNFTMITERVCNLFQQKGFTNYRCETLAELNKRVR